MLENNDKDDEIPEEIPTNVRTNDNVSTTNDHEQKNKV
jgi:hypothetical protein